MRSTPGMTAAAVKRLVGDTLYLAEHDGASWATNRYWLAPASRLAVLLDKFNVQADAFGSYEVNGSIRKTSDETPRVGRLLGLADFTRVLTRVDVAGQPAYLRDRDNYLALFADAEGSHVAVRSDWLDWLSDAPSEYGAEYGNVRLAATEGTGPRVGIVADKSDVIDGHYETGDDGFAHFVPRSTRPAGTVLLGVVMSCRIGS